MRKPKFEIRFDGTLQCHVKPAARAKALKKCIADGEQAIDLEVSAAGGGMYMFSRYPDQLPKGLMTFTWTGDHLTIVLKGCWPIGTVPSMPRRISSRPLKPRRPCWRACAMPTPSRLSSMAARR